MATAITKFVWTMACTKEKTANEIRKRRLERDDLEDKKRTQSFFSRKKD